MQWQRILRWEPPEFRELARALSRRRIEGWRYRQDLGLLYLLARDIGGTGVTLEIGSYKGLATAALAQGARSGGRATVHTVDPHTGDRQDLEHHGVESKSSLDEFKRNLVKTGIEDIVHYHVMTSDELAAQWKGEAIRVLFIDGWHSYDAVMSDIRNWVPLVEPTGAVLIDDYANYEDVRAAVNDAHGLLPRFQRRAGRMWLAHREPLPYAVERFLHLPWG
jgi:predicted O-methyltransferase YrrM